MTSKLRCLLLIGLWLIALGSQAQAVVPVIVGPLQALLALLPSILLALGGALVAFLRPSFYKKLGLFFWNQKLFTMCLIAVVTGLVFLSRAGWGRNGPAATAMRAGSDWPLFRGGPERRGAVLDAPEPTLPDTVWAFKAGAKCVFASPAVVGNRVYVTTADKGVFSDRGAVLCLDAETGAEVWRYAPADFRATFSSPSVKDGYLVVGEGLHYTTDSRINCLDLKGHLLWELRTKSHVESTPCIANGRVYVGAGDDGYYCVDLKPGPDGKPNVVWHLDGKKYPDCETAHLVADGMVFLGLGMSGNALLGLDADTGRELWRLPTPYPVFAPPALADGKLYVGMGNGDFVNSAEQVREATLKKMRDAGKSVAEIAEAEKRLGPAGEVWCIEAKSGKVEWTFKLPQTVLGAIAIAGDKLYLGCRDGQLYCLSTDGKPIKTWNAHEAILTSPAVGAEGIYVSTCSGRVHCLKADTLEPVWEATLGDGVNFISSPALALGHIYIGTEQEGLRCIGRRGEKLPPLWTNMERGGSDGSPLPASGQLLWRYPKEANDRFVVTAPIVPWGDCLAVACTLPGQAMLLKLKLGRGIEDEQRVAWKEAGFDRRIRVAPATLGEMALVADGASFLRHLVGGKERSQWSLRPNAGGGWAVDRRRVYLWAWHMPGQYAPPEEPPRRLQSWLIDPKDATVASVPTPTTPAAARRLIDPNDATIASVPPSWSAELGAASLPPAPGEGILSVATNTALMALDDSTGTVLWRVPLKETPLFGPVRLPKGIVLATPKGIAVHKIVDGSVAWAVDCGPLAAPLNADADHIAAITQSGELIVLAASDGKQLAKVSDVAGRVPPLLVGDKVLFVNKDLTLLRLGEDLPVQWARTKWLGEVKTPLVLLGSHIYFATDAKGVVCIGPGKR